MPGKDLIDRLAPHGPAAALDVLLNELKYDEHGLLTVVAQSAETNAVLMVAFANREALEKTIATGFMHYYSRSRGKQWKKGEESGHVQEVVSLALDCDGDALVAKVKQHGGGCCHLGFATCFHNEVDRNGRVTIRLQRTYDPKAVYKK